MHCRKAQPLEMRVAPGSMLSLSQSRCLQTPPLKQCCEHSSSCVMYRAPEGARFRPYDLLVVPREGLGRYAEYLTLSANGVMTIRKGVQAEFVPLASWVRQHSLFDLVSNIGFFKNYITGRAFRRWHKVC